MIKEIEDYCLGYWILEPYTERIIELGLRNYEFRLNKQIPIYAQNILQSIKWEKINEITWIYRY